MKKTLIILGLALNLESASALNVSGFLGQTGSYGSFLDIPVSNVSAFYNARGGESVWLAGGDWSSKARIVIDVLQRSAEEGLRPQDYAASSFEKSIAGLGESQKALADLRLTAAFMQYIVDQYGGRRELRNLDSIKYKGGHYDPNPREMLPQALSAGDLNKWIRDLAPATDDYFRLKKVLAYLYDLKAKGGWPVLYAKKNIIINERHSDVKTLREILRIHGDLSSSGSSPALDRRLSDALRRYQTRHGVNATGWLDEPTRKVLQVPIEERIKQVIVSMERWRWIPDPSDGKFIRVNIAGFFLTAYNKGQPAFSRKVIVGSNYRQTPTLAAPMTEIKFNPTWNVPHSIMTEDFLPKFKKDPSAFSKHNFTLLDGKGNKVTNVNWAAYSKGNFPYRMTQKGGSGNALGHIRFTIITPFNIYLHDTSNRTLFTHVSRTLSSGCIRVEDPQVLGAFALSNPTEWSEQSVLNAMNSNEFKVVQLPAPINVYLLYITSWADDKGTPYFFTDVYGRDKVIARYLGM